MSADPRRVASPSGTGGGAICTCYEVGRDPLCPIHGSTAGDIRGWSNVPAKPVAQTSGGICGMHGLFVGRACPKCVTQPKGLS